MDVTLVCDGNANCHEVWHTEPPNTAVTPNVALGDAHGTVLPIARDCIIAIGPYDKDGQLPSETTEPHNRLQVITADEYVYYRPGSDLKTFAESVLDSHGARYPPV